MSSSPHNGMRLRDFMHRSAYGRYFISNKEPILPIYNPFGHKGSTLQILL